MLDEHVDVVDFEAAELPVRALHVQQQPAETGKILSVRTISLDWADLPCASYTHMISPSPPSMR